jgi:hypothetical protein
VSADGEEFDHRGVAKGEACGVDHVDRGNLDRLAHGAVAMHAEHADRHAAIGLADPAGVALAAGDVGIDQHGRADRQRDAVAHSVDAP